MVNIMTNNNTSKTVREIVEENKGKEIHLFDSHGIWGELTLSEINIQYIPDVVKVDGNMVNMYIG